MIYALAVLIILVFGVLMLFFKPKLREEYARTISDDSAFSSACASIVHSFPLPKENGSKLNEQFFVSSIKLSLRTLKKKANADMFADVLTHESEIKRLANTNFDSLKCLPRIGDMPRVVLLADFCLKSSGFEYDGKRIAETINTQNAFKTLSFDEILSLNYAFLFVLLKKTAFLLENFKTLCKMKKIADKNIKSHSDLQFEKTYKQLKSSKLFMSFIAENNSYESEICIAKREDFLFKNVELFKRILNCIEKIESTDFSNLYAPLQIFSKYEAFDTASTVDKIGFLKLVKTLSDKENIDEFLFAIRIDNYMRSASMGHIRIARAGLFGRRISVISSKNDVSALALALSSNVMMNLLFFNNKSQKHGESITKNQILNNTFEQINKFKTVNFGISMKDGKLKIHPNLPKCFESVDIKFSYKDTCHLLHIKRGDEPALFLGNTRLSGTSLIRLSDVPIDVTYIIPKN